MIGYITIIITTIIIITTYHYNYELYNDIHFRPFEPESRPCWKPKQSPRCRAVKITLWDHVTWFIYIYTDYIKSLYIYILILLFIIIIIYYYYYIYMICRHMCISMTRTRIRHLTEASLTIPCSRLWGAYFVSKTPRVWEWPWPRMASSNWRSVMANPRTCGEISKAEWKSKLSSKIFHSLLRNAMIPSFFCASHLNVEFLSPLKSYEKRPIRVANHPCRRSRLVCFVVPGSVLSWKNPKVERSLMKAPTEAPGIDFLGRPIRISINEISISCRFFVVLFLDYNIL